MKKNMQLLRAMSEIRPQYIEDAGERTAKTGGITMRWRIAGGAAIAACFAVSAAVLMPGVQNALRETAASAESPAVQTEETTLPAETTAALMRTAEENETTAAAETALTEADYAAPALTLTTAETALLAEKPVTEALTVQTAAAVQTEAQTEAAVQTEAPAVTTLAETSAPRTTSETVCDMEKQNALLEAAWDKMGMEEVMEQLDTVDPEDEYTLLIVPYKILTQSYYDGYKANTSEQIAYLRDNMGDVKYRMDDSVFCTDRFLPIMCAYDYITEDEMFEYAETVANGGKLPNEIIALSEDSAFLQRYMYMLVDEAFTPTRSKGYYRYLDYTEELNRLYAEADLPNAPRPIGDELLFPYVYHIDAE